MPINSWDEVHIGDTIRFESGVQGKVAFFGVYAIHDHLAMIRVRVSDSVTIDAQIEKEDIDIIPELLVQIQKVLDADH